MEYSIFNTYTGNAMLNNALMTIEAMGGLNYVSQITPDILLELYKTKKVKELNKRLKSYTMLFSLNNPLVNPAKKANDAGENTYNNLMLSIITNFEVKGTKICEVSGLSFNKTFEEFYKEEIENQKINIQLKKLDIKEEKKLLANLANTDFSLNRSWFPLIGGLGSDAQALPQAKFTYQVHPICIVILQFLPLSAVLYKGAILLVDSTNFELSKDLVKSNYNTLQEKISNATVLESIENVRDFNKGSFILKALKFLQDKETFGETYSDLNLWSFSNSGTGASCEIDRVPNSLFRNLMRLNSNSKIGSELKSILNSQFHQSFLDSIESFQDWYFLYPNVFGSGKNKTEHKGYSTDFLENYYDVINHPNSTILAKYISGLIKKYKSPFFEKILLKTDAWNDTSYKIEVYRVLVRATENGEWNLNLHIQLLDDNDELPIKNNFFKMHKLIHFYYQKNEFTDKLPEFIDNTSKVHDACEWIISIIQQDSLKNKIISEILNYNSTFYIDFSRLASELIQKNELNIKNLIYTLFNNNYKINNYGLNELLRIYFSQPETKEIEYKNISFETEKDYLYERWFDQITNFSVDYKNYYYEKYSNKTNGEYPINKFKRNVISIIESKNKYFKIMEEAVENTNQYIYQTEENKKSKWSNEIFICDPLGNENITFTSLIMKISLIKQAILV